MIQPRRSSVRGRTLHAYTYACTRRVVAGNRPSRVRPDPAPVTRQLAILLRRGRHTAGRAAPRAHVSRPGARQCTIAEINPVRRVRVPLHALTRRNESGGDGDRSSVRVFGPSPPTMAHMHELACSRPSTRHLQPPRRPAGRCVC
jgi:hypothetical protein